MTPTTSSVTSTAAATPSATTAASLTARRTGITCIRVKTILRIKTKNKLSKLFIGHFNSPTSVPALIVSHLLTSDKNTLALPKKMATLSKTSCRKPDYQQQEVSLKKIGRLMVV
jgi:hypothetical protein